MVGANSVAAPEGGAIEAAARSRISKALLGVFSRAYRQGLPRSLAVLQASEELPQGLALVG